MTSVAADGTVVDRGGVLFTIDRQPTVLLVGAIPVSRELSQGVDDGPDVAQLEENLTALGYTDGGALVVDEHFDGSTTDAVEAWQEALGVEPTGAVTAALAVFLPGSVRIVGAALDVGAGAQEGAVVVDTTSTTRVVQAQSRPARPTWPRPATRSPSRCRTELTWRAPWLPSPPAPRPPSRPRERRAPGAWALRRAPARQTPPPTPP